jgi:hypothetical protein
MKNKLLTQLEILLVTAMVLLILPEWINPKAALLLEGSVMAEIIQEDAEDGDTDGWKVYTSFKGIIRNQVDPDDPTNRVIEPEFFRKDVVLFFKLLF